MQSTKGILGLQAGEDVKEGKKFDSGKPRWSLLPEGAVASIVDVLEAGAIKYAPNNWQLVPDGKTRYYDAAMRHIEAWRTGEMNDPETGLPHLAHAGCCLMFLGWLDTQVEPVEPADPASDDGWIEWKGGERPIPNGTPVDVVFRDNSSMDLWSASSVAWNHSGGHSDIIKYRVVK